MEAYDDELLQRQMFRHMRVENFNLFSTVIIAIISLASRVWKISVDSGKLSQLSGKQSRVNNC